MIFPSVLLFTLFYRVRSMKTNPQIIKFLSFCMIGLVVGTMICNYHLSGRVSAPQGDTRAVSQAVVVETPSPTVSVEPLPVEMPAADAVELDIFKENAKETPTAPPILPDVIPFTPEPVAESVLPEILPEAIPAAAPVEDNPPVDIFSMLDDLPATQPPQELAEASRPEVFELAPPEIPENNANLPDFLQDSAPAMAENASLPAMLPGVPEPEAVRQNGEAAYVAHTPPPSRQRRQLAPEDIYDSPWSDADAIPAGQVSQVASHVGSAIPNPLRPQVAASQTPPVYVHVAPAPVQHVAPPVQPPVQPEAPGYARVAPPAVASGQVLPESLPTPATHAVHPAAVSPQMGHGLPAGIPAVAAPAELPASLPSEIPVLPTEIPHPASPTAAPNTLASAGLANPSLPVDGMLPSPEALAAGMSAQPTAETNEIILKFRQTDIRRVIHRLQERTGLGIYTSIEVQGEITCDIQSADVDEILRRLLGATSFGYARDGGVIYIGRRSDIQDLPVTITERGGRRVTPQHISLDMCERFIREHLSPYGECTRQKHNGMECLVVKDMELALLEMDRMLELVDIAPVVRRLDAFVFERTSDDKKYLSMKKVADSANVTVQEYVEGVELEVLKVDETAEETKIADDDDSKTKKGESKNLITTLFGKENNKDKKADKKKSSDKKKTDSKKDNRKDKTNYRAYVLSHRIDALLMALEDEKDTELICDRKGISRIATPGVRVTYPVTLNFGDDEIQYVVGITEKKERLVKPEMLLDDEDNRRLTLDVECRLAGNAPEIKGVEFGKPIIFSGPMQLNHALIFQGKMGDFPDETNFLKTVTHAKRNSEMIIVFILREDEQQFPRTELTNVALKYLTGKCEQVGMDIARASNSPETDEIAREFLTASKTVRKIRNAK